MQKKMFKLKNKFKFVLIFYEFISGSEGTLAIAMEHTCISNEKIFFFSEAV